MSLATRSPQTAKDPSKNAARIDAAPRLGFLLPGITAVLIIASFPWSTMTLGGVGLSVVWSMAAGALIATLIRLRAVLMASLVSAFVLAYTQGLGDVAAEGTTIDRITASPEASVVAVSQLLFFLLIASIAAVGLRRALGRRQPPRVVADPWAFEMSIISFVVIVFGVAVITGFWSFWGSPRLPLVESGGIRLELSYPPALLLAAGHIAYARLDHQEQLVPWPNWLRWSAYVALAAMIFTLQSRRTIVAAGLILGMTWILRELGDAKLEPIVRRQRLVRLGLRLSALGAVLAVFTVASLGWRTIREGEEVSLGDRFERAVASVGDSTTNFETIESRLTYLWFDGVTWDLSGRFDADLDSGALLASTVARAVPRLLMPGKDEVPIVTCEAGLEGLGLPDDMPCTPTSEGRLIGGLLGVAFAALLWGLSFGLAEHMVGRGGLQRAFALVLVYPFFMLEEGIFAPIPALRGALIAVGVVALIYVILRFARQKVPLRGFR